MTEQLILRELHSLPESLKVQVLKYVQGLKKQSATSQPKTPRKRRQAGSSKGRYVLAPDFDAPLEDFKEYMP